jgi:hypothetical protein
MSNRQEHTFAYTGGEIAKAISDHVEHLRERVIYYTDERHAVLVELMGNSSVEWREHEMTGGKRYQAVLVYDQEKARWLDTCQSKIAEHTETITRLERVKRPYAHNRDYQFALDPDDVDHFHLGDASA